MKRQHKVRKSQGEIVNVSEIFEKKTQSVKNFGIVLKYQSRADMVNMYKEYRATTLCGAVSQMYQEMAGRHSARPETIHIIKTVVQHPNDVLREQTRQYLKTSLRFPKFVTQKRAPTRAHRKSVFTASRPTLI
jgi:large subunit ribosomal protein L18Ae